jgi:L-lysine exporter family protein LysE/ArgO
MEMFLAGFALSLSASLDLGIVNVATIKRGLDSGARAAFVLQVGSCLGDMTYALLSMFGLALVLADPRVRTAFWLGGTVVLLYLAATMVRDTRRGRSLDIQGGGGGAGTPLHRDFFRGIALALSSPSLIIWFATAGGAVIAGVYGRTQSPPLLFLAGFFSGGIAWAAVLSLISGKGRHMIGPSAQRAFSAASAMLFAGLAVKVFLDGLASRV